MPIYTLGKKTYEIFPNLSTQTSPPEIDPEKLKNIANFLSEYFGCFMIVGMSLQGEPQVLIMAASGMEQLAVKQFAQDVCMGEADMEFTSLDGDEEDDEEGWKEDEQ
jgi:hypothetical protein